MRINSSLPNRIAVSVFVLSFSVCMVSPAFSAVIPCTCSGSPYVIIDTNMNGEPDVPDPSVPGYDQGDPQAFGFDAYWTMEYDDATNQVMVNGHGIFPNKYFGWTNDYFSYQKSSTANSLTLTEEDRSNPPSNLVITASKVGGAQGFNKVDFSWKTGMVQYASAAMIDSTGDGSYDSVLGESDMHMVPPILFDKPIQFYTHPTTGKNYWLIPEITLRTSRTFGPTYGPRTCCYKVFVPVGTDALEVQCGNDIWGRVMLTGEALGPRSTPVPTLNEWGSILTILLLLVSGIWVMRKTGFGEKLPRT